MRGRQRKPGDDDVESNVQVDTKMGRESKDQEESLSLKAVVPGSSGDPGLPKGTSKSRRSDAQRNLEDPLEECHITADLERGWAQCGRRTS